jgi:hypothetical protein
MADHKNQAKSILGGKLDLTLEQQKANRRNPDYVEKRRAEDDFPGPSTYAINPIHTIPGFVIKQPESKVLGNEKNKGQSVGP